jgi:hypothetical protein
MGPAGMLARLSRRSFLRFGLAAMVVAVAGVKPLAAQQKADKKLVKYQDTPKGSQSCGHCLHFVPPDQCKLVAGKISPKGWCQLFAPKPK